MGTSPLNVWLDRNGKLLRLCLARPNANIIDAEMIAALDDALATYLEGDGLLAVMLDHEGANFSYGASVEEHLPDQCAIMLQRLHGLIRRMVEYPVPILAAIRGQCLGGGLEVAAACSLIFAAPDARLGQPEIKIGVFAPAASCILPERIGQARAEDLLLSGRSVTADEGRELGLVTTVAEDPVAAALAYFDQYLEPLSGSVLRYATRAVRAEFAARIVARLGDVETLYLSGLMNTKDAVEGLQAFVEKRPVQWTNR